MVKTAKKDGIGKQRRYLLLTISRSCHLHNAFVPTTPVKMSKENGDYRDSSAFSSWFGTLFLIIMFMIMQRFNYPEVSYDDALTLNMVSERGPRTD